MGGKCHGPDHEHEFILIYTHFISFYTSLFHFNTVEISPSHVYSIYVIICGAYFEPCRTFGSADISRLLSALHM